MIMCIIHQDRLFMSHNWVFVVTKVHNRNWPTKTNDMYTWVDFNVTLCYKIFWWCLYTNNNHYLASMVFRLASLLTKETSIHISLHTHYIADIFNNKDITWILFNTFFWFQLLEIFPRFFKNLHQNFCIIFSHCFATTHLLLICYKAIVRIFCEKFQVLFVL